MTLAECLAELDRLDLDLYLEQRVLYRQLVAEGGHREPRRAVKARLDKVSLCRSPAYVDARVLAIRER